MIDDIEHTALHCAIHDPQGHTLRLQTEAPALHRERYVLARAQLERAGRLEHGAASMQSRATTTGKIAMWLALPASALILLLVWRPQFAEVAGS